MEVWGGLLMAWSLVVVSSMAYAFRVVVVLRPQKQGSEQQHRALALLPLLPIFIYVPWLPSSCHVRTFLSMVFLWTAPSKLLLLCFNSSLDPFSWVSSSFSHFLFSTLLPVQISHAYSQSHSHSQSQSQSQRKKQASYGYGYGSGCLNVTLLILVLNSYLYLPPLPPLLLCFLYCIHFYLGLELLLDSVAALFSACFSVALLPQFDRPYLSSSLAEFWGRRWNIAVNGVLRASVYQPLLGALAGKAFDAQRLQKSKSTEQVANGKEQLRVPIWAPPISMLATFAVSGIMHEVIFVYVTKSEPTGEMMAFFVLHGLATVLERALKKSFSGSIRLPRFISGLFTLTFLYVTVSFFFLRPLHRVGTDLQAIAEYHQLQNAVVSPFRKMFVSHVNQRVHPGY